MKKLLYLNLKNITSQKAMEILYQKVSVEDSLGVIDKEGGYK